MYDTYWATGDEYPVKLTDENFDKFELVFDFNDVERFSGDYQKWITYDDKDRFRVSVDSGGMSYPKYYIRRNAVPRKAWVVERLNHEIKLLEDDLAYKKTALRKVEDDEVDLRYV